MKKVKIILLFYLLYLSCDSVNNTYDKTTKVYKTDTITFNIKTLQPPKDVDILIEDWNYTDTNDLKQGKWVKLENNKFSKIQYFKDGYLDGVSYELTDGDTIEVKHYVKNKLNGICLHCPQFLKACAHCTFFQDDKKLWTAFPQDLKHNFIPFKGFILHVDSAYIKIPYKNGNIFYEGKVKRQEKPFKPHWICLGEHKIYYQNGNIEAKIDYDIDSIKVFNRAGKEIAKESITKWRAK